MGTSPYRLLVIEDDKTLAPSLSAYLNKRGFNVSLLYNVHNISEIDFDQFDLIVLDLILPGMAGEDILFKIKKKNPDFPVLILTAKYSLSTKEECFNKGADDYLTKPFEPLELELRIKALLRRFGKKKQAIYLGDVSVNMDKKTVSRNGVEIALTGRCWQLLEFLIKNQGKIIDKRDILKNVWGDTYVSEDSIRAYVKELRKIFPKDVIKTYKGRGYRLM